MPDTTRFAFGVMLGLGLMAVAVAPLCVEAATMEQTIERSESVRPKTVNEQPASPAANPPVLSLQDALRRSLQFNPKLAAFSREVEAREYETLQAGLRPNPELSVEVENIAGSGEFSGTGRAETTIRLSQLFELGGKRAKRRRIGRQEQQLAAREYDIARTEVQTETRQRFIAVLAARERLVLAEEQTELARKVLQATEDRIATGKAAQIERVRFGTLVAEARLRRDTARQNLHVARRTLADLLGSTEPDLPAVQGRLESQPDVPSLPALTALVGESPQLALRKGLSRKADLGLEQERAGRIPELELSLGVKEERESGDHALLAEVSIPLPIFDRNQGMIAAARARKAKTVDMTRSTRLQLRAELSESYRRLQAARTEADALREEILPAAEQTFAAVEYGYRAGKFGFLDVLDAERALFEAKSRYIDALLDCHQAISALEHLLGPGFLPEGGLSASTERERSQR